MSTFTTPKGLAVDFDLRGTTGAFWPGQEDNYHYCSIFGARSALIGTRLYIDGGYVLSTIPNFGEPNNRLLWVDFDKEFEWGGGPGVQSTPKPSQIPSLIAGTAFSPTQSSKFYIFGGVYKTYNMMSSRFQPAPSVGGKLFSYSKDTGEWTQEKTVGYQPQQVALGMNQLLGILLYEDLCTIYRSEKKESWSSLAASDALRADIILPAYCLMGSEAPPDWGVLGQVCQKLGRSLLMTSLERANRTCVEIVLVYDLEEPRWQSKWVPNQDYAVPMLISAIIGGSHSGRATDTKPRNGWSLKDLENALTLSNGTGLRQPGPTSTANLHDGCGQVGHSKNTGANSFTNLEPKKYASNMGET
ncbi:hypothetical protein BDD12DRAFT_886769 [Trichophaea hybrida]|nr:hypothetical protein BDD12DRAFT_886769 [Trichophaea hybrida]